MAALFALGLLGSRLQAATVIKADNTDNLALGSSWVGGVPPSPADIILWDSTVTGANTVSLGAANLLIGTVQITNPGGLVTLNGLGTLQLGAIGIPGIGIDMSSATADLRINANIALEDTPPASSWIVAEGRTLTIAGSVSENGPGEKILTITGAGVTRITGNISDDKKDDLSLVKSGTGTLILAGANDYSGDTTVNQGVLNLRNSAALRGTKPGNTIVNAGGELQLQGNISLPGAENLSLTGTGAGGPGSAALRNISDGNQLNGPVILQDAPGVVRINSDSGSLAFLGNIDEDGPSDKILTFGGSGEIIVGGTIRGGADTALAKDGTGTLNLTGNNSFAGPATITGGAVILSGNGGISLLEYPEVLATSAAITVSNATLTLDNTLTDKNDRIGNRQVTLNGGTFNFIHGATSGDFTETIGGMLILNSGASTISTDASAAGGKSILTFDSLALNNPGATVNFGGGTSNPSAANDDNNVRFNGQAAGVIGAWATVGGTSFATYNTASSTDSVEALVIFDQTVTRLSSGTKFIANTPANNVLVTDGTGTEGNITLAAAPTTINTLTNSATGATGTNAPAGGVTIDPAGQALQVNGILNGVGSSALTIGTGTNNGTLTAKTAGGELIIYNFSSNAVTVNSVIANNTTASSLTKAGSGSVVLTGANTYTGSTLVNNGTLEISGASGALSGTSNVTVNTGGTLLLNSTSGDQINNTAGIVLAGGTLLKASGVSEGGVGADGMGTLTLSASSTIDFGTEGVGVLTFGDFVPGPFTLTINNWTGTLATMGTPSDDRLIFSADQSTNLAAYEFTGFGDAMQIDLGGGFFEVVPVPEPGAVLVGLLVLAPVAWRERRLFLRVRG